MNEKRVSVTHLNISLWENCYLNRNIKYFYILYATLTFEKKQ